mgnify:CR=1 FL=1
MKRSTLSVLSLGAAGAVGAALFGRVALVPWANDDTPTPDACAVVLPGSVYRPSPTGGGHWFTVNGELYGWSEFEDSCIEPMAISVNTPAALVELVTSEVPR